MVYTPEQLAARLEAESLAGREINHIGYSGSDGFMPDTHHCSCGWVSPTYFDGGEYAYADWVKHIIDSGAEINYPQVIPHNVPVSG